MDYRFTVGADESFPLPPSASPGLLAGTGAPLKVLTAASYSSDSSGDSGISLQFQPSGPFVGHSQVGSDAGSPSPYSDRTAEWLGTKCETVVSRRPPRVMNVDTSCRHSTASSGSGSGSSGSSGYLGSSGHVTTSPAATVGVNRLSNVVESRLSYISEPSSSGDSRTSLDRLDSEQGTGSVDVLELLRRGFSDSEVLYTWLAGMRLEQLYQLFIHAGYDMPTISRMTPEDLTAIGITQPIIRKRLTSEISRLNIDIGIPNVRMLTVQEWLRFLNLEEYYNNLTADGYTSIEGVMTMAWEDLEEIGIHKLGHQKKLMLAIDRLKKPQSAGIRMTSSEFQFSPSPMVCSPTVASLVQHQSTNQHAARNSPIAQRIRRSISGEGLATTGSPPGYAVAVNKGATEIIHLKNTPVVVRPEVVAIQVNRTSNKFATDGGSESSAIKYESFRGPTLRADDVESRDPVEDDRSMFDESLIIHNNLTGNTGTAANKQLTIATPTVPAAAGGGGGGAHSPLMSASCTTTRSPPPNRARPQIAPKPKMEIRQRRASAGASSDPRTEIAAAAAKVVLAKNSSQCSESLPMSSATSKATSLEVLAGQPPSGRRLPCLPPSGGRNGENTCNGMLNGQIAACSMTSLSQTVNSEVSSSSWQPPYQSSVVRVSNDQTISFDSVESTSSELHSSTNAQKRAIADDTTVTGTGVRPVGELSRPPSHESPRRAPPVPPKRTNSFKGHRSLAQDTNDDLGKVCTNGTDSPTSLTRGACSSAVSKSSAATNGTSHVVDSDHYHKVRSTQHIVRPSSANSVVSHQSPSCSPGPFDNNSLPFANENVGTIRQRGGAAAAAEAGEDASRADRSSFSDEPHLANQRKVPGRPVPMKKPKVAVKDGRASVSTNEAEPVADDTSLNAEDVFNDIDSMFQGLTQELDQMLMS